MLGAEAVRQSDDVEEGRGLQPEQVESDGARQPCRSSIARAAAVSHPCSVNPLLEAVKRPPWPGVRGRRTGARERDFGRARPPGNHWRRPPPAPPAPPMAP